MARGRWRGTSRRAIADGDLSRLTRAPAALVRALEAEMVARQVELAEHVQSLARSCLEAAWTE
jgi:hypothetical protein